jgi:hypothetical protein
MDRKMDSGYLEAGETMQDDYDFSKALLPEEIIGIIDQLLCHEVWFLMLLNWTYLISHRWAGTWAIRSPKHFLLVFTSTGF